MPPAVEFNDVRKEFTLRHDRPRSFKEAFVGTFRRSRPAPERLMAVDRLTFALEAGGSLGLVGPNGTGKSTCLKLAARILEPTSGTVRVRGRVAALLELGAGFHPELTGRENVYLNGSLMGLDRRSMTQRLEAIVDFAELERFIDMPVKHYSSGMYMRLGFATAIHVEPEVLLIDEVLAVGDQAFQSKCRERIAAVRKAGVTIMVVSHDIQSVREICERALWLEDGTLQGQGPTDEVVEAYYRSVRVREESRHATAEGRAPAAASDIESRWGSGEVQITGVEFLGPGGAGQSILLTGEPATVRISYFAREPVEAPVFGLAIHRQDGVHVAGPNTKDDGLGIDRVEGTGTVTFALDALPLTEGTYELSVSCYDWGCTRPFDYHHRSHIFRVRAGSLGERFGLIRLAAKWDHQPGS